MEFDEQELPGGVLAVAPKGRLNMVAAPVLRGIMRDRVAAGRKRIVLDLAEVQFLDSSGLGAIIGSLKTAREAGGDVRLARAPEPVLLVLRLTKVDRILPVYPDAAAAFNGE